MLPAFEEVFARTRGRVLVSCFATSIPRIQRVADLAVRTGRPVAFVGRRMIDNAEVAMDLGLLRIPLGAQVPAGALGEMPPGDRTVVFVSGSQGEPHLGALPDQRRRAPRRRRRGPATRSCSRPARSPATSAPSRA